MNVSVNQAASSMSALAQWQEVIAGNLSAAKVPGFKAGQVTFEGTLGGKLPHAEDPNPDSETNFILPTAQFKTLLTESGNLERTGVPTHLAIDDNDYKPGDPIAFFKVELDEGEAAYTRDGEFNVDAEGNLITKHGYGVFGPGGPILLPQTTGKIEISPSGMINIDGKASGEEGLTFDVTDPETLAPKDHGLFAFSDPNDPQNPVNESDTIRLKPGFLESSNVKPMQEMTRLIEVIRAYESKQRVIQSHDQRIGQVISGLGNPVF